MKCIFKQRDGSPDRVVECERWGELVEYDPRKEYYWDGSDVKYPMGEIEYRWRMLNGSSRTREIAEKVLGGYVPMEKIPDMMGGYCEVGVKYDDSKNRLDLIPVEALEQVGEIYSYGARKYADSNWRKGIKFSRLYGATLRHLFAFWRGEDKDKESGLPHLAHATFGLLGLLQYQTEGRQELDDRFVWERRRIQEAKYPTGEETKKPVREVGGKGPSPDLVAKCSVWSPSAGQAVLL